MAKRDWLQLLIWLLGEVVRRLADELAGPRKGLPVLR